MQMDKQEKGSIGLYIHIPFCKSKCYYCDFNSLACAEGFIPGYFEALKEELRLCSESLKNREIETVFIGGGTPSYVDPAYIYETLASIQQFGAIKKDAEISIETNPGTLSYEKLAAYRAMGINRLSIGLQAWQNPLLKSIGRIHCREEFVNNYQQARKAGFRNINIDLMFGLLGQSLQQWEETLDNVLLLQPEHISAYSLKVEEGTVFGDRYEAGELVPVEDELDREMYYKAIEKLILYGMKHYEISNFALPGYECRHNKIYWEAGEYIGIGAGAHSYSKNYRYNNHSGIENYVSEVKNGRLPQENLEFISKRESISEYIILGLRFVDGINLRDFQNRYGEDIFELYGGTIRRFTDKKLLLVQENQMKLTAKGLDFANDVMAEFL